MRARAALLALASTVALTLAGCRYGARDDSDTLAGATTAQRDSTSHPRTATDLAWMSGTWRSTEGESVQEESWTEPLGGTLFGIGRTVVGGRTRFFEHLRIEARPDGLVYVASPLGRGETEFELRAGGPRRARFENPTHDWPTSIEYELRSDGRLTATVSGPGRTEEYVWVRHGV